MRSHIHIDTTTRQPNLPAVMPNPTPVSGPLCQHCLHLAVRAAHYGASWNNAYAERWLQYSCELFMLSTRHTFRDCTNTVGF